MPLDPQNSGQKLRQSGRGGGRTPKVAHNRPTGPVAIHGGTTLRVDDLVVDVIAAAFHDTYERLAPEHGYETREASRTAWRDVPENNRALMRATVRSLIEVRIIHAR